MWHLKTTIVSVIVGALGITKKGRDEHIIKVPGTSSFYLIQKIAFCRTAHILKIVEYT